jgi:hypothetical protein
MADVRSKFSNKAFMINVTASTDVLVESDAISFRTEEFGISIHTLSTVDGDLQLQVYMGAGTTELMADADFVDWKAPRPITGGVMDDWNIHEGGRPMRVRFTADTVPHTTKVSVWGYGG